MDFIDQLRQFSKRVSMMKRLHPDEEATKLQSSCPSSPCSATMYSIPKTILS